MNDEKLISLVQSYSYLYDKTEASFKHKDAKESAWEAISKKMQLPVDVCIRRWNTLRERFTREVRHYTNSGSGNDVRSTWHLYSAMTFLQPFIKPRRTRGSSNVLGTDSPEVIPVNIDVLRELGLVAPTSSMPRNEYKPGYLSSPPDVSDSSSAGKHFTPISPVSISEECEPSTSFEKRKRKESSVDKAMLEALDMFKKVCQYQMEPKNSAVESFGRMITATVNEMSAAKQSKAMRELTVLVMTIKEEPE